MSDNEAMYKILLNATSQVIEVLQDAQLQTEGIYILSEKTSLKPNVEKESQINP